MALATKDRHSCDRTRRERWFTRFACRHNENQSRSDHRQSESGKSIREDCHRRNGASAESRRRLWERISANVFASRAKDEVGLDSISARRRGRASRSQSARPDSSNGARTRGRGRNRLENARASSARAMSGFKIDGCNALITGASAGIGREFARQLAGRAASLVLVARRGERLEQLQDELIKRDPNLHVRIHAADLSRNDQLKELCDWLAREKIDIEFLINN